MASPSSQNLLSAGVAAYRGPPAGQDYRHSSHLRDRRHLDVPPRPKSPPLQQRGRRAQSRPRLLSNGNVLEAADLPAQQVYRLRSASVDSPVQDREFVFRAPQPPAPELQTVSTLPVEPLLISYSRNTILSNDSQEDLESSDDGIGSHDTRRGRTMFIDRTPRQSVYQHTVATIPRTVTPSIQPDLHIAPEPTRRFSITTDPYVRQQSQSSTSSESTHPSDTDSDDTPSSPETPATPFEDEGFEKIMAESPLKAGIYHIINADAGLVMDLTDNDSKTPITGQLSQWATHQKWEVIPYGEGYHIRSVHSQQYLSVQAAAQDKVSMFTTDWRVVWKLERADDPNVFRIIWPTGKEKLSVGLKHTHWLRNKVRDKLADKVHDEYVQLFAEKSRPRDLWRFHRL